MSFQVFFDFSLGLSEPLKVPKGTFKKIMEHVHDVESTLGYETEQNKNNQKHWKTTTPKEGVSDEVFCEYAEGHNGYVRILCERFAEWSERPPKDAESLTPKQAQKFWHGLTIINVPWERWTKEYYKARMDAIYATMRGHDSFYTEGMSFDAKKPLTIDQANEVITLFAQYLDAHDIRLDVPKGYDSLYDSDNYAWCDKCGAIHWDDVSSKIHNCRKKGGCSLRRDYPGEI